MMLPMFLGSWDQAPLCCPGFRASWVQGKVQAGGLSRAEGYSPKGDFPTPKASLHRDLCMEPSPVGPMDKIPCTVRCIWLSRGPAYLAMGP